MAGNDDFYYVITKGRLPSDIGIYTTWGEVNPKVSGVSHSTYKKVKSYEEAIHFLKEGNKAWDEAERAEANKAIQDAKKGKIKTPGIKNETSDASPPESVSTARGKGLTQQSDTQKELEHTKRDLEETKKDLEQRDADLKETKKDLEATKKEVKNLRRSLETMQLKEDPQTKDKQANSKKDQGCHPPIQESEK